MGVSTRTNLRVCMCVCTCFQCDDMFVRLCESFCVYMRVSTRFSMSCCGESLSEYALCFQCDLVCLYVEVSVSARVSV